MSLSRYNRSHQEPPIDFRRKVALIYGVGAVVRGASGFDAFSSSQKMGSETVAGAFRDAIDDDEVEAILFRVNSPGGSYVASDSIWRETIRAKEAGKPVIVSMGDVAGSGGYFVAMSADSIVAHPGTITGSIGVYGGKLVSRALWGKVGVTFDEIVAGDRARMFSSNHDFDDGEWQRMQDSLDRIYEDFTAKVAKGRSLTREEVHEIARGRIWTGEDALELGLVDELGGFPVAMRRVREAIGADEDEALRLQVFPRLKTPWELLREGSWAGTGSASAELAVGELMRIAAPLVEIGRELGLIESPPGPLTMWQPESR